MRLLVGRDLLRLGVRELCWVLARCRNAHLENLALAPLSILADTLHPEWRAQAAIAITRAGITSPDAAAIVRQGYHETWRDHLALCGPETRWARGRITIDGLERLEQARRRGRGVVLLESSRFGLRYTAKRALFDVGVRAHAVHGPIHLGGSATWLARRVTATLTRDESRFGPITWIPGTGDLAWTREVGTVLGRGGVVCSSGDGLIGQRFHRQRFLGRDYPFATGWVSLARTTRAALIPMVAHELGPRDAIVALGSELEVAPEREAAGSTIAAYALWLEAHVRQRPDSYTMWHRLDEEPNTEGSEAYTPNPAIIRAPP